MQSSLCEAKGREEKNMAASFVLNRILHYSCQISYSYIARCLHALATELFIFFSSLKINEKKMRREENVAYITSNRPATTLGLIPKNRMYNDEQMRGALIFSDLDARRQVSVSGMGEFSLPPDRVKLIVVITSTKSKVNEANASVIRRLKYAEQTLRNYGVKEQDKSLVQSTSRRDTMYEVTAELTAIFVDIQRYQDCHNRLVEKLDAPIVRVLDPVFFHSTLRLENLK
jgi:hypothetical protein